MKTFLRKSIAHLFLATTTFAMQLIPASAQVDLASFGSSTFNIDTDLTTSTLSYSQTASGITFSPSVSFGDILGGNFQSPSSYNWSAYNPTTPGTAWYVKLSILSGTNPNLSFTLNLINTVDGTSVNLEGDTTGATTGSYLTLSLNSTDPGDMSALSNIDFAQFTWNTSGSLNVRVEGLAAVPEPSTYALLTLGALALGGYALRRRQRA